MSSIVPKRMAIAGAVVLVLASIVSTIWVARFLSGQAPDNENKYYRNVSFTDAVLTCEEEARVQLRPNLVNIALDDHSSRYEHKSNLYKVFLRADVNTQKHESGIVTMAVHCFVRADRGAISRFDQLEDKTHTTEPIHKRDGGVFGWPI